MILSFLLSFILTERDISIQIKRFIPQRRYNNYKHIETTVFQIPTAKIIKTKKGQIMLGHFTTCHLRHLSGGFFFLSEDQSTISQTLVTVRSLRN